MRRASAPKTPRRGYTCVPLGGRLPFVSFSTARSIKRGRWLKMAQLGGEADFSPGAAPPFRRSPVFQAFVLHLPAFSDLLRSLGLSFVSIPVRACPFPPSAAGHIHDERSGHCPPQHRVDTALHGRASRQLYRRLNDRLHRSSNAPGMMPDQAKLIRFENQNGRAPRQTVDSRRPNRRPIIDVASGQIYPQNRKKLKILCQNGKKGNRRWDATRFAPGK